MKFLFLLIVFCMVQSSYAVTTKKSVKKNAAVKTEDKVYAIEKTSPEIVIGENTELTEKNNAASRPADLWYGALVRSSLNHKLPSVTGSTLSFSPTFIGIVFGKKVTDQFFLYKGYYEVTGEWQKFDREAAFGNSTYSQRLNLYQLNIFQNFNVAWVLKHSVFFSVGIGFAPVYVTTEQNFFGNSSSELGYMGMLKGNIVYPLKRNLELDLALKLAWGGVGSHEISASTVNLGLNFE